MKIGDPQHEIYIEPIELPEPLREEPAIEPEPERIPEKEPAKHGEYRHV